ncbi:MAG TPA: 4-hydroxy-tetrahydrodipicolinate synthase [Thermoanaerobaculia bacterium]|nr:4-hydroxy-tetrahydrodipicolinate synthase [Thermoanaerobaculia bacterium]
MKFRGVGTALVTPFKRDGSLDEEGLRRFVEWQITEGIHFLVPCGTTGENPTLQHGEHRRVVEITVQTAKGRVPVLAGAGGNSTPHAVELAAMAVDLGADGILTVTPYYNKPTTDGLRRHFGAQAEAVDKRKSGFPMILYNVPSRTGLNMTAETTLALAREIPNIAGVKEASANMEQILTILRERREGFAVLSGEDAWTLPLMAAGADGVISVASNEVPRLMSEMVERRDVAIHNRLLPLLFGNFIESNPGPAKAALAMMGVLDSDTVRPPLAPMTEASRKRMKAILEECRLLKP